MTYYLYHYYEEEIGPFRNLSSLTLKEAYNISHQLKQEGKTFASQRSNDYLLVRKEVERLAREQFIQKGGKPKNLFPHYMTLQPCDWLKSWYKRPAVISIDWDEFLEYSISFTYGDLFPTMRYSDHKPYRKQVYNKQEVKRVIEKFGFPQDWNRLGDQGPERYIEVQIWDEEIIRGYM